MTDITDAIKDNNERVNAIIADTEKLAAKLEHQVQQKQDNEASRALFKALGWEK